MSDAKCVNETNQYLNMICVLICVAHLTFSDVASFCNFAQYLINNQVIQRMFATRCWGQSDRIERTVTSCVCQHLWFILYFAIKTLVHKLRTRFRFLDLIDSLYRMFGIYNISNILSRFDRWSFFRFTGLSQHYSDTAICKYVRITQAMYKTPGGGVQSPAPRSGRP